MRDSGLIMHKIPTLMHRNLMHLLAEAFTGAKRVVKYGSVVHKSTHGIPFLLLFNLHFGFFEME